LVNGRRAKVGTDSFLEVLAAYDIVSIDASEKAEMQAMAMRGPPWYGTAAEKAAMQAGRPQRDEARHATSRLHRRIKGMKALADLQTIWLVTPAFNEERVIAGTLKSVMSIFTNVVVVDDCSTDKTTEIALESGAHVCRHPVNLGQGAALQTGIDYALAQGAEHIVTFDADGQHRPGDALAMIEALVAQKGDIALASRFLGSAEGMSIRKRYFLKAATLYTRLSTGLSLSDTHNGLRALTRAAAQKIRIRQNRMAHASEILDEVKRHGLRYIEVPCRIIYTDYSRAKGQRMSGAFAIMFDLYLRKLYR
jgi:polyprenyl-phospho-N-acetylgalactosaminyl synthase